MFDVYNATVDIHGEKYTIVPLNGDKLPLLYKIIGFIQENKAEEDLSKLFAHEESMRSLIELANETIKLSYPDKFKTEEDTRRMQAWVSQNLVFLFPAILDANMKKA